MRLTVSQVRIGSIALLTGLAMCMAPSGPDITFDANPEQGTSPTRCHRDCTSILMTLRKCTDWWNE